MKLMIIALLCSICLCPSSLLAQEPKLDPLLRWMNGIAQQQLQERENAIAEIRTVSEAERRRGSVRAKLLDLLGGLPDYNGALNPRITGSIKNEFYTIEKVIFENWMGRTVPRGDRFRYRYMSEPDDALVEEFLR